MDDRGEGLAAVMTLKVLHVLQQEGGGAVMVDDLGQIIEQCSLCVAQEAVWTAKGVLLADTRNRERLARETGQQHVMGRDCLRCVRVGPHILGEDVFAVRRFWEIGAVGLPAEPVPLGREYAPPADGLEGQAQTAYSRKKVDEPETLGALTRAARIGCLSQLLQPELVDPLAFALHVAADRAVAHAQKLGCSVDVEARPFHQFRKFRPWMRVHVPAPALCWLLTICHNLSQHVWEPCFCYLFIFCSNAALNANQTGRRHFSSDAIPRHLGGKILANH